MKLLVFLGNPGKEYEKTRHNAGFLCGDYLQKQWGTGAFQAKKDFQGVIAEGVFASEKILFLKPQTFMNLSGESAGAVLKFYKIPLADILVVHDDKDLPFGVIRFRAQGSAGGHRGIRSLIALLGTKEFARVKIGVEARAEDSPISTTDFVLGKFSATELAALEKTVFPAVAEKVQEWLRNKK